jgi:P4 family phage/plasmid primase-like protien
MSSAHSVLPDPEAGESVGVLIADFLALFYPNLQEPVHLRAFVPHGAPDAHPVKTIATRAEMIADAANWLSFLSLNENRGLYFVVNAGGDSDADINRYNAVFVEGDDLSLEEQNENLNYFPLETGARVQTKKSIHGYFPLKPGCTEADFRDVQERLIAFFKGDPKIKNPSRVMRLPYTQHLTYIPETKTYIKREVLLASFTPENRYSIEEFKHLLPPVEKPVKPQWKPNTDESFNGWEHLGNELKDRITSSGKRNTRGNYEMACPAHDGKSDTSLFFNPSTGAVKCLKGCRYAEILLAFGLPAFPVHQYPRPRAVNTPPPTPPGDAGDEPPNEPDPPEKVRFTDMGNGLRFATRYLESVRYCKVNGKWYIYDDKRWRVDEVDQIMLLAKDAIRDLHIEAAFIQDEAVREKAVGHAIKSESDGRMAAMVRQAQSELATRIDDFDCDPFLLNCNNGTVDLRICELQPHRRADMLTKLSPITFDQTAHAPKWEAFLVKIFGGDQEIIRFAQKSIGYSLTGDVTEQCLFICFGTGANGKSVFLKTVASVMGEYAQSVRTESLMARRFQSGASNDIAALKGVRFGSAQETESDHRLAESTVKALTGGDRVRARFLFQEEFEFSPQFKLWMASNHKPEIRGNDHGIWRRIKLIPFNVTIPKSEQNPNLDLELREEMPGILAWAVQGCMYWQQEGLGQPAAIEQATADYRSEMDTLADFLDDRCVIGEHFQVTSGEMYSAYSDWCTNNGETAASQRRLGIQLKERGFRPSRDTSRRFWKGIGLVKNEEDRKW